MSAFNLSFLGQATRIIKEIRDDPAQKRKRKKVEKALFLLQEHGPSYPSLRTHLYENFSGPHGEKVFQSYIENNVPQAWRMWWFYGPDDGEITVYFIGPHP